MIKYLIHKYCHNKMIIYIFVWFINSSSKKLNINDPFRYIIKHFFIIILNFIFTFQIEVMNLMSL